MLRQQGCFLRQYAWRVGGGSMTAAVATLRGCRQVFLTTSAQKRSLNREQLEGSSTSKTPLPPSRPPPTTSAAPTRVGGGGSTASGGNMLPMAALGLVAVGGGAAAYYYYNDTIMQSTSLSKPIKEESKEKQAPATTTTTVVATTKDDGDEKVPPVKAPEKETDQTPEAAPIPTAAAADTSTPGHRVTSIAVPPKMKNVEQSPSTPTTAAVHPKHGHRVTMNPRSNVKPIDDASVTEKALAELRSQPPPSQTDKAVEQLESSTESLSNMEGYASYNNNNFADLDTLNTTQLKARIVQLATEMKDRTKWEALRLKEFLAMKEKETADKYMEVMQKQRLEFEDLLAKRLREQETDASNRMIQALQEKEMTIQNVIKSALDAQESEHQADMKAFEEVTAAADKVKLEDEYANKLLTFKQEAAKDMEQRMATLKALTEKLSQLEAALETTQSNKEGSLRAHRLSAAALSLAEKLETNQSAHVELNALKAAAGRDGVIATALATIPGGAEKGVPTLSDLQARFGAVHKKCRQAALVPTGRPGLGGQLAGMVFAAVKYPPNPDDPAPEADKDNAEYVLVRAQQCVQLGQLERAVEQLEKLQGQPAFTVADWKKDALHRIAVENALKVIKMECALLNESLVE